MRLISLDLSGYRRFGEPTKINLDGKLIALAGPNEAGKSTILDALLRLQDPQPISQRERTRPSDPADGDIAIKALWLLEPGDIQMIDIPAGAEMPRWFIQQKAMAGSVEVDINPRLRRDRGPRERTVGALRQARSSKWLGALDETEEEFHLADLDGLITDLESDEGTLPTTTIERVGTLISQLSAAMSEAPKYAEELPGRLQGLIEHETAKHPTHVAQDILAGQVPRVIKFELEARELGSSYDLQQVADSPPTALANLATLADLDLVRLRQLIETDDRGAATEVLDRANAVLEQRIREAWGQSEVESRLTHDDFIVRIFVRTGQGGLQDIAERSDGLRAFLALVAFTSEQIAGAQPVLLIDEAEIHLHYDAQADLVQMLGRQRQARQIIYTTHSAGCLPPDLGTGVRLVVPSSTGDRSTVDNWPWAKGGGFDPLLLGMGASAMAFVPTRAAVIGEGAGEVVLLPTLLRETMTLESLEFQVAPGASEASSDAIALIDLQGSRVAWLVDGDQGGADNRAHLRSSGIPSERIVTLGGEGSGLAVEDLVDREVYVGAVNEEIRRSYGVEQATLVAADLGPCGWPVAVENWCADKHLVAPNKGAIAHRIAEQRSERDLVGSDRHDLLRSLHHDLMDLLAPTGTQDG